MRAPIADAKASSYDKDMDDQRTAVLETRFNCILPTLATKSDIAKLRAEILSELRMRDTSQRPSDIDWSEVLARSNRTLKVWCYVLVAVVWIVALWLNIAVYVEGERIVAAREAVAAAQTTPRTPPVTSNNQ